ncbi:hypothetical protein RYX36_037016 [Vicia faba]
MRLHQTRSNFFKIGIGESRFCHKFGGNEVSFLECFTQLQIILDIWITTDFITVFDPGDVLMFLTKMQLTFFNHPAVWITIFDPGGASTLDDGAFFAHLFSDRSKEDSHFRPRYCTCAAIHDLIAELRFLNGFTK